MFVCLTSVHRWMVTLPPPAQVRSFSDVLPSTHLLFKKNEDED